VELIVVNLSDYTWFLLHEASTPAGLVGTRTLFFFFFSYYSILKFVS